MFEAEAGTTVKFTATFTDTDDTLIAVDTPTLTIYDVNGDVISTDSSNVVNESLGVYSCVYETPKEFTVKKYFAEFSGTYNGDAIMVRDPFKTKFDI